MAPYCVLAARLRVSGGGGRGRQRAGRAAGIAAGTRSMPAGRPGGWPLAHSLGVGPSPPPRVGQRVPAAAPRPVSMAMVGRPRLFWRRRRRGRCSGPGARRLPLPGPTGRQGECKVNGAAGTRPGAATSPLRPDPAAVSWRRCQSSGPSRAESPRARARTVKLKVFPRGRHFSLPRLLLLPLTGVRQHKVRLLVV